MMERRLDNFSALPTRSVHVFPVLLLEKPSKPRKYEQKQDDPDTERAPLGLRGLAHIVEKVDRIVYERIVLLSAHASRGNLLEVIEHMHRHGFAVGARFLLVSEDGALKTLELREHRRH